jgi:hypothetical protein
VAKHPSPTPTVAASRRPTATWWSKNSTNALGKTPQAFFSFKAANPDGFDHLRASFAEDAHSNGQGNGKLTLKWEGQTSGGDKDFDDWVITATGFQQARTTPVTVFSYTAQANDVDGDTLSYSLSQAPSGASINSQTGVLTWSPSTPGNYSFTIRVSDGKGGVALQTFSLTVKAAGTTSAVEPGCASIVVRSSTYSVASNDDDSSKTVRYIVVNGGASTVTAASSSSDASGSVVSTAIASDSALRVDWGGTLQQTIRLGGTDDWVSDFLGTAPDQRSLAEKTGLVVKVKV